jgi:hypothetical protein
MGAPGDGELFAFRFRGSGLQIGLGKGKFALAPARSIHRDRASNGDAVHPQRPAQPCRRARFRWSSDLSFDALRCRPLRCVGILNGMTAKHATLRNCVSAAQRGILTSREVSGGGLAHQGHTPSTSGSRPSSKCLQCSEQRKRPKSHGRDGASSGGARHDAHAYTVAVLRPSEGPKASVSSRSLRPGSVM